MHLFFLFHLGLGFCHWLIHAVIALFQAFLLAHKPRRVLSKLLTYSRVFREESLQRLVVPEVVPVICERRIPL